MPLLAENAFQPDLESIPADVRARANLLFCNYPNNPTGAVIEDGFFERLARFGLDNDIPIVHDSAYSEITFDGHVAAASSRRRVRARRASRCSRCPSPGT